MTGIIETTMSAPREPPPTLRGQVDAERSDSVQLTDAELRKIECPKNKGIGYSTMCFLGLWIGWIPALLAICGEGLNVWIAKKRSAMPRSLGLVLTAVLFLIPIITTLSTVGAALAFYLWAKKGAANHSRAGYVLVWTLTFGVMAPAIWGRGIARHQTGAETLPFEPDVDPTRGIRALRGDTWRFRRPGGFMPACTQLAISRAESPLQSEHHRRRPGFWETLTSLGTGKHDRRQLLALFIGALLWTGFGLWIGIKWWFLPSSFLTIILVRIDAVIAAKTAYWERLRWARRESDLRQQLKDRQAEEQQRQDMLVEVRALRAELGQLSSGQRKPSWLEFLRRLLIH